MNLFSMLTVLFVGLKLAHVITWSWWAVLAPVWVWAAMVVGIILLAAIAKIVE